MFNHFRRKEQNSGFVSINNHLFTERSFLFTNALTRFSVRVIHILTSLARHLFVLFPFNGGRHRTVRVFRQRCNRFLAFVVSLINHKRSSSEINHDVTLWKGWKNTRTYKINPVKDIEYLAYVEGIRNEVRDEIVILFSTYPPGISL